MTKSQLYHDQFLPKYHFPDFSGKPKPLIIASSPRSGSHMLGHILYGTGLFGYPLEYLQPENFEVWEKTLNTKGIENVLLKLQQHRTSPNGVFGMKLHCSHLSKLNHSSGLGNIQTLHSFLPNAKYILIWRKDPVAQAISFAKASQTGVWISGQQSTGEPSYNYKLIHSCLRNVLRQTAEWRYQLSILNAPVMDITFEDLVADISTTVQNIIDFMEIEKPDDDIDCKPLTSSQQSPINQEWARRFRAEHDFKENLFEAPSPTLSLIARKFSAKLWRRYVQRSYN